MPLKACTTRKVVREKNRPGKHGGRRDGKRRGRERQRQSDEKAASRQLTAHEATAIAGERCGERKRKKSLQLASRAPLEGRKSPARPRWPPLLSLPPYLLSPRRRHPLSRFLSLTLFLSLPVCMVKYCIIVLTAGRKTAQPVVPARRVARIRAACTLLSRPRPTASSRGSVTSCRVRVISVVLVVVVLVDERASQPVVVHPLPVTFVLRPRHLFAPRRSNVQ